MQRSTVTISIKAFKYRESQANPDKQKCIEMIPSTSDTKIMWEENGNHWFYLDNVKLTKRPTEENTRNPGFIMFSSEDTNRNDAVPFFGPSEGICPSSGMFLIVFEAKLWKTTFSYRYNTLKLHQGFKKDGALVETRKLSEEELSKVDIFSLPMEFWKQISLGDDEKILLRFTRKNIPLQLRQSYSDDVTGELYCYGISKICYFSREN